jgi:signal transduction histidine kinase
MRSGRAAWPLAAVAMSLLVAVIVVSILNRAISRDASFLIPAFVIITGYSILGAILASRNPHNPIGWLLLSVALVFVLSGLASEYADYSYLFHRGDLAFTSVAVWTVNWSFNLLGIPILLILLLFPTGTLPSRRWAPVAWGTVAIVLLSSIGSILRPTAVDLSFTTAPNPTGVAALMRPVQILLSVTITGYLFVVIASVVALAQRFRRADGEERQQIRWLAYVAVAALATVTLIIATGATDPDRTNAALRFLNDLSFYVFLCLIGFGVPIACTIAVLRYRLWDLDLVVKKTVLYTVLTLLLVTLALLVLLIAGGAVVGVGVDRDQPLVLVLTGVAIGLSFPPLRRLAGRIADRLIYGGRATPYEVLTEFSDRVAGSYSTDDVLPRMAQLLGAAVSAAEARVWLVVERELRPVAAWPATIPLGEARGITDRSLPFFEEANAFEVRHQGELLGALTVRMPASDVLDATRQRVVRDLAGQAGLVLRNVRLIEDLRASRQRLVAAQDQERRKLERNLHDGAQQQIVALSVKQRLASSLVARDQGRLTTILDELQLDTADALEALRDLARGIYPPLLADQGLGAALEAQARKAAVPVSVEAERVGRHAQEIESAIYFSCLEALNNVAKYAEASNTTIRLSQEDGRLRFTVTDDGRGFDPGTTMTGTGLQGMRDRMAAVGGELRVVSAPGEGTEITGEIPVV